MKIGLLANWVAPMDGALIRDGAVIFEDGRIVDVGSSFRLKHQFDLVQWHDLGQSIILPGLVNAHVHLELSSVVRQPTPPPTFGQWLLQIVTTRRSGDPESAARQGARIGRDECLHYGISTVGDISRYPAATRSILRTGPLRVVSFGEIQALGTRRTLLDQRLYEAVDDALATATLRVGISPHAPYTVEPQGYARALSISQKKNIPLTTHLAESEAEWEFLSHGTGDFRALWDAIGGWDNQVPRYMHGPIHLARDLGLLSTPRMLLAHVNYCDDEELAILAKGRASVIWCPRTHDYFGHPLHRFTEMLRRGINVCIGTDSKASSPNLNIVEDLRLVHSRFPQVPAMTLWSMVTARPAQALGLEGRVGTLVAGGYADITAFPLEHEIQTPLQWLLETPAQPPRLWIAGQEVSVP